MLKKILLFSILYYTTPLLFFHFATPYHTTKRPLNFYRARNNQDVYLFNTLLLLDDLQPFFLFFQLFLTKNQKKTYKCQKSLNFFIF